MIETQHLTKSFGSKRAVDDVTVGFPAGAVTALLGLNGAGKTTLLRLVAGLDRPDAGTVTVSGRAPCGDPRLVGVHLGPGALDPNHTVTRHLRWLAALAGAERSRVGEVVEEAGLTPHGRDRVGTLSLGARQRLSIAGALLCRPQALLFDEPLNGLDVPGIVWFRGLLRQLADTGCAVVLATHLLSEVVLSADRVVLLQGGRPRADGPLSEVVPAAAEPRDWLEDTLLDCVACR
ncbi:ABC transporter ATP-binding protein [Mycolicibacterium vaccae]|uniref:ABC transporter--like protein n=1 Tax=Mycolicibacterium vaccae ATCC 25954 TaxID=1194972 RepID=K0UQF5_MYCVA|nr:ATP-binding cassette domain-containing protein [Mycolicibacterium vaccae]ANI39134.1 multidrug ABC transporter ATPase [Mycolicibacterium vaccae 95051]EJZ04823.1 ABC transporter--like protein [Mycolicibacterium vaccae ATCC 25954]MCV7063104.1 ATP-binding cassette domain-containing protein [Mycolicibacterium vaccae]